MKRDSLPKIDLSLTIDQLKKQLTVHYGMYVTYVTKQSKKQMFDYQQWSKSTVVNGDFINNIQNIKGLIMIKVYFESPLLTCNVI